MPAPLPLAVKTCERCGIEFRRDRTAGGGVAGFERRRFCSKNCRNRGLTRSGKPKRERPLSMAGLAVLAIFEAIQDEHGLTTVRLISRRYWQLRGMSQPIRPSDGQPDVNAVNSIIRNLETRGLLQRRPGVHQGTRNGAFRITPLGRKTVQSHRGLLVGIAKEPGDFRKARG